MAIAWSRISSKVIAYPPYADAACSRRCGKRARRAGACIPQMGDKRKPEMLCARRWRDIAYAGLPFLAAHGPVHVWQLERFPSWSGGWDSGQRFCVSTPPQPRTPSPLLLAREKHALLSGAWGTTVPSIAVVTPIRIIAHRCVLTLRRTLPKTH